MAAEFRENLANLDYMFLSQMSYGVLTQEMIQERGAVEIKYGNESGTRTPLADAEKLLGPSDSNHTCNVCSSRECQGHEGYILFPDTPSGERAMVFNPLFMAQIKKVFSVLCMSCCRLAVDENDPWTRDRLRQILDKPAATRLDAVISLIGANSQKYTHCVHYTESEGKFYVCPAKKKVSITNKTEISMELMPTHLSRRTGGDETEGTTECGTEMTQDDEDSRKMRGRASPAVKLQEDVLPRTIYDIFRYLGGSIDQTTDCEYLGLTKEHLRGYFMDSMLIIPTMFRPKVEGGNSKITQQLTSIINRCANYKDGVHGSGKAAKKEDPLVVFIKDLQAMIADYHIITRDIMGHKKGTQRSGIFGKRPDFNARNVISPSPIYDINQFGIPELVAAQGLVKEMAVTEENIVMVQQLIFAGKIAYVKKLRGRNQDQWIRMTTDNFTDSTRHIIEVGDEVRRHGMDGDLMIIGRQPTANRHNILGVHMKVIPGACSELELNLTPGLNADFDGDTMHMSIVQIAEGDKDIELMLPGRNVRSDQRGAPAISLTYNGIVAASLLTIQQLEISESVWQTCTALYANRIVDLDARLAKHGVPRRSGRALFSTTLPPDFSYTGGNGIKKVVIKDGVLVEGMLTSSTVGAGEGGIIDQMSIEYHPDWEVTYNFINAATAMLNEFVVAFGFSVTYTDCLFGQNKDVSAMLEQNMEQAMDKILRLRRPDTHYEKIKYEKDVRGILNSLKSIAVQSGVFSVDPKEKDFLDRLRAHREDDPTATLADVLVDDKPLGIDTTGMSDTLLQQLAFMARYVSKTRTRVNPILELYIERALERIARAPDRADQVLTDFKDKLSYVDVYIDASIYKNNLIMMSKIISGQKGNEGNLTSIGLELGQQQVMGMRLPQTVTGGTRMVVTQRANSLLPPAKGYVRRSWAQGLTPNETQAASQMNREGMAATATVQKVIGTTQRSLERGLEPIKVDRGAAIFHEKVILTPCYGGDAMDGVQLLRVNDVFQCCDLAHKARQINVQLSGQRR